MKQQSRICYQNEAMQSNVWQRGSAEGRTGSRVSVPTNAREATVSKTDVSRRSRELQVFHELLEDMVDLLCDAARGGSSESIEARYVEKKMAILRAYSAVRPFLVTFMKFSTVGAESVCEGLCGDAFSALVAPRTVADFLTLDDGAAISRIQRVRDAIERYQRHLNLLCRPAQ